MHVEVWAALLQCIQIRFKGVHELARLSILKPFTGHGYQEHSISNSGSWSGNTIWEKNTAVKLGKLQSSLISSCMMLNISSSRVKWIDNILQSASNSASPWIYENKYILLWHLWRPLQSYLGNGSTIIRTSQNMWKTKLRQVYFAGKRNSLKSMHVFS